MLIGEHTHTLDEKGRLSLPSKFRKILGNEIVVTRGLDHCLFIYSLPEWKEFTKKLAQLSFGSANSRAFGRFMLSGATQISPDKAGRILIPNYLQEFAELSTRVIVAGMVKRVEIWNEESWNIYKSKMELEGDSLAEQLGDIGMI